jgi:hypothetical protein
MPTHGHTSGVRLFGSDQANAGRREWRRRMRADSETFPSDWVERNRLSEKTRGQSYEKRDRLLCSGTVRSEGLRGRACVFLRHRATGHVCATSGFASLRARPLRQNARCCRHSQWRDKNRQRDREQDRCCLAHYFTTSTNNPRVDRTFLAKRFSPRTAAL